MRHPIKTGLVALGVALALPLAVCQRAAADESAGAYIGDAAVTAKVKTAILTDSQLKVFEIHVTTYHGVVRLDGTVDSETMIGHATEVARHVGGVKAVHNDLYVK